MANRYGAVDQNANADNMATAQQQAASIGATIGSDGWWRDANGKKMSHADADKAVLAKGTAIGGQKDWGLGKGTLGDITGGRIGDVHVPPAVAEALRMAAEAGGSLVGIPPQLIGALAANIGHGKIDNLGTVLKRGIGGAIQGAGVGGATQGVQGLGSNAGLNFDTLMAAGKGAMKGVSNPFDSYTKAAGAAAALPALATMATKATGGGPPDLGVTYDEQGNPHLPDDAGAPQGLPPVTVTEPQGGGPTLQTGSSGLGTFPGVAGPLDAPAASTPNTNVDWMDAFKKNILPSLGTIGSKVGNFLTGNNGMNALAAAQLANAAYNGSQAGDYAKKANSSVTDWWNKREPLRTQGQANMLAPPTQLPQLSALSAQGNPFAKQG